jgi:integrase
MESKTPGQIIAKLATGKFANLGKVFPAGTLEARKLTSSATFYWRVTLAGKTERTPIGFYDSGAPPKSLQPTPKGYSIAAATHKAQALAQQHHDNLNEGGYTAIVTAKNEAKRVASEAVRAAEIAKAEAARHTLENLLTDYCDHQQALGRVSHSDARSIFKLHVKQAWPKIAAMPASEVTAEQFADMMRKLMEAGKGRTANKLRSYARSAYQMARAARSKASVPVKFKAYCITHNPVSDTEPDEAANKADKNPLTADEMRTYWRAIKGMKDFKGGLLRLHLLTGGQRLEQLVNLKTADISENSILLFDGKGRPGKPPRPHQVPLIPAAATALGKCKPVGLYALSTDGGKKHVAAETLSEWAMAAGAGIAGFQTKRLRSGTETLLASAHISTEMRGRLQSHGISGVQARHYDGHDYIDEKTAALKTLYRLLDAPDHSNVVPMKSRARRAT